MNDTGSSARAALLVCLSARFGGADVRVLQTAKALPERGWSCTVAALEGSPLAVALADAGVPLLPISRRRGDPRIVRDLSQASRRSGACLIDAHNMQSQYWAAAAALAAGIPGRVATVHSVYHLSMRPGPGRRQLHEGALRVMRRAGAHFIAVSGNVEADLLRLGISPDRMTLSWNGLEPLPVPPPPSPALSDPPWPADAFVLAMIGRLEEVKEHRVVIAALAAAVAQGDRRLRMLVVGEGRDGAALRELVRERALGDRVYFTGFRTDIPAILTGVDLLCIPSRTEGLPYVALEACRQAVPLLAPQVPWIVGVFGSDPSAFIAPDLEPESLGQALRAAANDLDRLRSHGEGARALYERRFTLDRMIDGTCSAYASALGETHG